MTRDRDPVRTALIGYGLAGRVFHAPLIRATAGMRLVTVVTANAERGRAAGEENPGARVVRTAEGLWALAGEHDLAVVAAPNRHHAALAHAAIEAGLAVVVEKPLAPGVADARALVEAAHRRGSLLSVFHNRRWDADFLSLRRLLDDDALGPVTRLESRFERWRPRVDGGWRDSGDPRDGGGVLLDLGTHLVDQAVQLFGRPLRVCAEVERRRPRSEVDDDVFVALEHPSGVRAHLWMSAVAAHQGPRLRVLGLRGAYVHEHLDPQEAALSAGRSPGGSGWGAEPTERWGRLAGVAGERPVAPEPGAWPRYYEQMVAALRGEAPVPVVPEDAVEVLEIVEAARRSAATASVVTLPAGRWPLAAAPGATQAERVEAEGDGDDTGGRPPHH